MLLKLAKRVTTRTDVHKLSIVGLRMEPEGVIIHTLKNRNDINKAMFGILVDWRDTQPDLRTAYINLGQALIHADMDYLITIVLHGKPEDFENGRVPQHYSILIIHN